MTRVFSIPQGMPRSVFQNKYARKKSDGTFQSWAERVTEVVEGNFLLDPRNQTYDHADMVTDLERTLELARAGVMAFSGRHLQHGGSDQKMLRGEKFTNCSTAMFSFIKFWLLLKGSGVGRCYDGDLCRVNWDNMPNVRFVLRGPDPVTGLGGHPDYEDWIESLQSAQHAYDSESESVRWFEVADSAEGWVKVVEVLETAAWQEKHRDKLFIFDFSSIRPNGTPIVGQQGRPASGPIPLIKALVEVSRVKGAGMRPWKQAMFVDHYLASCVALGGVRRSARIATKTWRDRDVIEFVDIKRGGFLQSANNSVTLDDEFWEKAASPAPSHARRVFEAMTSAGYFDRTGEPGYLNVHEMTWKEDGLKNITADNIFSDEAKEFLSLHPRTLSMVSALLDHAKAKKYPYLVNPCVTGDTWVMTDKGPRQVLDLQGGSFTAIVDGKPYRASAFWKTGTKQVYRVKTARGYEVRLTENHKVKVSREGGFEWVEVGDLVPGDDMVINNHKDLQGWSGKGTFEEGWLVGEVIGDGGHNPDKYLTYVRFWGSSKDRMAKLAADRVRNLDCLVRSDFGDGTYNSYNDTTQVAARALTEMVSEYLTPGDKLPLASLEETSSDFHVGFLRGFFDADGSVQGSLQKGVSVRLAQHNRERLVVAQRMLARLGIASTVYFNRKDAGMSLLPDGRGGMRNYPVKAMHELVISRDSIDRFAEVVGFEEPCKAEKLGVIFNERKRGPYRDRWTSSVTEIVPDGVEDVYDCTVDEVHEFDANGLAVHNCGEIVLACYGGYCVIGDICLANAESLEEVLDSAALMAKFLMRTNTMPFLYEAEVARTNRIGVGLTGIHEFAYKLFGLSFYDLLDTDKSKEFWSFICDLRQAVNSACEKYASILGCNVPHTQLTMKPSGTISKIMFCTEGAHLSAFVYYLRWVQYPINSPEVSDHIMRGYPVKDISHQYPGHVVVGFPTKLPIADLTSGEVVCASDVAMQDHYRWLQILEENWLGFEYGNQISYTLSYNPAKVGYEEYMRLILDNQPHVRACSVMPEVDLSAYAYLPQEKISKAKYEKLISKINRYEAESYSEADLACESGACPIEFNIN